MGAKKKTPAGAYYRTNSAANRGEDQDSAARLARSVLAQELGVLIMAKRGVLVVTASGEDLTATDDPAKVMMRQVAGAFAEYEKARLVAKLRGTRDRASARR